MVLSFASHCSLYQFHSSYCSVLLAGAVYIGVYHSSVITFSIHLLSSLTLLIRHTTVIHTNCLPRFLSVFNSSVYNFVSGNVDTLAGSVVNEVEHVFVM